MNKPYIIEHTRAWLMRAVIGLNLCPFAKAVHIKSQIRYVVSDVTTTDALFDALCDELQTLIQTSAESVDTTLLIHPLVLADFYDYNNFLNLADMAISQLRLQGTLQIASFHPDYQFADSPADDISNATNRSPYPMLHILREASIDKAVVAFPEASKIFDANIQTMTTLGTAGWNELRNACRQDAQTHLKAIP